jgi:uncharacterized membrane protein
MNVLINTALFTGIDAVYLGLLRRQHHLDYFAQVNGSPGFSPYFAVLGLMVWFLLGLGVEYFVIPGATSVQSAALRGALLGFIVYGVYDLTNLVALKNWTVDFSIQDMIWGTVLTGAVSATRYYFIQ